jgi:STE24 endopeptidase
MNEDKATRYHRLGRRAGFLSGVLTAGVLLTFVLTGTSAGIRNAASEVAEAIPVPPEAVPWVVVTLYVVCLTLLHELVALPCAFYRGFVLDRRYGLLQLDARSWLRDHVRVVLMAGLLGLLVAQFIYYLLRTWPDTWWLAGAAAGAAAGVLLTKLAPVLLLPVFYRFTPLRRDPLRQRLEHLAARGGARLLRIYEWQVGHRTSRANAAFVGLGRTGRILLSDTLLAQHSDEEIEVIVAHEMAHHVHGDMWKGLALQSASSAMAFLVAHLTLLGSMAGGWVEGLHDVAGLPAIALSFGLVWVVSRPFVNALSRAQERRADRYALEITRNPGAFVSAMQRLAAQNLAEEVPPRLAELLLYTHPPLRERIRQAQALDLETA